MDDDGDEEEGLPSPPLDEGAFFAPETTAIKLSEVLIYLLLASNGFCVERQSNFSCYFLPLSS